MQKYTMVLIFFHRIIEYLKLVKAHKDHLSPAPWSSQDSSLLLYLFKECSNPSLKENVKRERLSAWGTGWNYLSYLKWWFLQSCTHFFKGYKFSVTTLCAYWWWSSSGLVQMFKHFRGSWCPCWPFGSSRQALKFLSGCLWKFYRVPVPRLSKTHYLGTASSVLSQWCACPTSLFFAKTETYQLWHC